MSGNKDLSDLDFIEADAASSEDITQRMQAVKVTDQSKRRDIDNLLAERQLQKDLKDSFDDLDDWLEDEFDD